MSTVNSDPRSESAGDLDGCGARGSRGCWKPRCSPKRPVGIGIPKGSALKYKVALKTNHFLLIVHDTPDAAKKVKDIIEEIENSPFGVSGEPVLA